MSALGLSTLRDLIESLPAGERRLILLRYADQLSDPEIAHVLDMDTEQVTRRLDALEGLLFEKVSERFQSELAFDQAA